KKAGKIVSYTKGAPDLILNKCDRILLNGHIKKITSKDKKEILAKNNEFSKQALRVLGFAYNDEVGSDKKTWSKKAEKKMIFVGLQAMIDPPREEVKLSIEKCREAGIRVIMITGDHLVTAQAIAKELGIIGRAVEGKDIGRMDLRKDIRDIGIFARVNPEHKMKIVEALQQNGEIVAMTGDGVNDAPALKKANIGVAMGITGTDVSKEASDMILTDDNFTSIVGAVEEGRNIYDNIKKFVNYMLSSNLGEVLILFAASFIFFTESGEPLLPLLPLQILWINLITDGFPALALGVDPPDKHIMKRQPRNPKASIITKNLGLNIVFIGIMITIVCLLMFNYGNPHVNEEYARTLALTSLVVLEIVRLAMIRSQYHTPAFSNKWLVLAIIGVFGLQAMIMYVPAMASVFKLVPLNWVDWGLIAAVAGVTFIVGMLISYSIRHWTHEMD
ncbi:HAD-IC family P-type ATPase, partial [Candidatus Woesearchaeota archaeon]|nr:HAD-IC family P-type ATPase [Candidatus Woesearchaeota archaeon]